MKTTVYCNVCDSWVKADLVEIRATDEWIEFILVCKCGHRSFIKILDVKKEDEE